MNVCRSLKGYCLRREWARNAFAFLGVAMFLATIWVAIDYQLVILDWLYENFLIHGAMFGLICAVNVSLMSTFLCLGFSDCSAQDHQHHKHSFRGRGHGKPVFPEAFHWIEKLGNKRG